MTDKVYGLMFLAFLLVFALGQTAMAEEGRLTPEEFPIMAWGSTPGSEEIIAGMRECGFNIAGFMSPKDADLAAKAGLKCIVIEENIREAVEDAALTPDEIEKQVRDRCASLLGHPGVFGYYLKDEPGAGLFPSLARWVAAFKKEWPEALAYINLLPNYATPSQLGTETYEDYLERFVETVKPSYISYDHYALMDDGSLRQGYFRNLESVRRVSLKHNLPFWNIILSNCHFHYAEPSPNGLRFQVYTTLAYGGGGISYFTYFTSPTGNYRLGPIDQFGDKTPTWAMLRNVNLQIHKLGPTYIGLRSINVFHHPDVPEGCIGIETSKHLADLSGGSFVVGEFLDENDRPVVMVVNKDLHLSTSFDVKFKQEGQIMMTNAYTGRTHSWSGEQNWLAPGQGMLMSVSD